MAGGITPTARTQTFHSQFLGQHLISVKKELVPCLQSVNQGDGGLEISLIILGMEEKECCK